MYFLQISTNFPKIICYNTCVVNLSNRKEVRFMHVPNEKIAKEKNTVTIHKILHKLLEAIKIFYEICRVLKAILNLFF